MILGARPARYVAAQNLLGDRISPENLLRSDETGHRRSALDTNHTSHRGHPEYSDWPHSGAVGGLAQMRGLNRGALASVRLDNQHPIRSPVAVRTWGGERVGT